MSFALFTAMLVSVLSFGESQNINSPSLINGYFDTILDNFKYDLKPQVNGTVVPIPDLVNMYDLNLPVGSVTTSLTMTEGRLSNLMTLRRMGDVSMNAQDTSVFFKGSVTLDTLKVVFGHYTLEAGFLKHSGDKLALHVRKNVLDTLIELQVQGSRCEARLDNISLRQFSDVTVDITGFSILNPIVSKVAEWVISYFNDYFTDVAQTYIFNLVDYTFNGLNLCDSLIGNDIAGIVYKEESSSSDSLFQ